MSIDTTLALATVSGLGILAPCLGLFAYKQLADHFRSLPAAVKEPQLLERVSLLERECVDKKQEITELQQRAGELNGVKGEAEYWRAQIETARQEMEQLDPRRREFDQVSHQLADAQEKLARVEADHAGRQAGVEELAARHDSLETSLVKLADEQKGLLADMAALQPQCAAVRQQLETDRVSLADVQARVLAGETQTRQSEAQLRELLAARSAATQELERLQQRRQELAADIGDQERERQARQHALDALAAELQQQRLQLDPVARELGSKQEELSRLEREASRRHAEIEELDRRLQALDIDCANLGKEVEARRSAKETAEAELSDLRQRLANGEHEVAMLTARKRELLAAADAAEGQRRAAEAQNREIAEQRAKLDAAKTALEGTLNALQNKPISLTSAADHGPGDDPLAELQRTPSSFRPALHAVQALEELQALQRLRRHLAGTGLQFAERTLLAFHTCLKIADISPLTVLAGISGTGKSALPRHYAEALGLEFLLVPVQPRWDGPQDLLGFYNYLEKRFKATELSQTLVRLDRKHWSDLKETLDDRVVLVLLDEMNLARVEYYFSDFLSLLEIRRDKPERALVQIDLGQQQRPLQLVANALFVGTMNEDESTQSLSDKVLDRANLLRFARPRSFEPAMAAGAVTPLDGFLPKRLWDGWRREPTALSTSARRDLDGWIKELNAALDRLGRPFGHRVQQAILAYAANHPGLTSGDGGALAEIFVDQMEQRVLPKLRGLDTSRVEITTGLDELAMLLRRIAADDRPIQEALDRARNEPLFVWAGAQRDV